MNGSSVGIDGWELGLESERGTYLVMVRVTRGQAVLLGTTLVQAAGNLCAAPVRVEVRPVAVQPVVDIHHQRVLLTGTGHNRVRRLGVPCGGQGGGCGQRGTSGQRGGRRDKGGGSKAVLGAGPRAGEGRRVPRRMVAVTATGVVD